MSNQANSEKKITVKNDMPNEELESTKSYITRDTDAEILDLCSIPPSPTCTEKTLDTLSTFSTSVPEEVNDFKSEKKKAKSEGSCRSYGNKSKTFDTLSEKAESIYNLRKHIRNPITGEVTKICAMFPKMSELARSKADNNSGIASKSSQVGALKSDKNKGYRCSVQFFDNVKPRLEIRRNPITGEGIDQNYHPTNIKNFQRSGIRINQPPGGTSNEVTMDENQKKVNENSGDEQSQDSNRFQTSSNPKDIPIPNAEGARSRNYIAVGSPANMFSSILSASPPSFISMEQILKAAEDVSKSGFNMALAHEIAVNKDFKLQQTDQNDSLRKKITEVFHQAFFDILQEQISSDPPDFTQAMVLLKEIKEVLLWLLLPHNTRLKNEINEVLDIDLIEQQTKKGTVDVLSYAQFVISTMARICAPARDAKIQELRQLTEVVPLYRGILETLDLMKLDMVNFTISHIRPHIQQHSVEYEKGKFKEILQSLSDLTPPIDGLKFTRLWLQEVYEHITNESSTEDISTAVIIRKAYIKILQWKKTENFPETLHLDHERFITLRDNLTVMILTASVILVTYSNVGSSIQGISEFKDTLKRHIQILLADAPQCKETNSLEAKMEAVGLQVVKEVDSCLDQHGYSKLGSEKEEKLVALIKQIASEDHSVRQLIMKRILEFLELALHSPANLKIPPGLSSLQNELSTFAGQFLSLIKHNQAVFGDYYCEIIDSCKKHQQN